MIKTKYLQLWKELPGSMFTAHYILVGFVITALAMKLAQPLVALLALPAYLVLLIAIVQIGVAIDLGRK